MYAAIDHYLFVLTCMATSCLKYQYKAKSDPSNPTTKCSYPRTGVGVTEIYYFGDFVPAMYGKALHWSYLKMSIKPYLNAQARYIKARVHQFKAAIGQRKQTIIGLAIHLHHPFLLTQHTTYILIHPWGVNMYLQVYWIMEHSFCTPFW